MKEELKQEILNAKCPCKLTIAMEKLHTYEETVGMIWDKWEESSSGEFGAFMEDLVAEEDEE